MPADPAHQARPAAPHAPQPRPATTPLSPLPRAATRPAEAIDSSINRARPAYVSNESVRGLVAMGFGPAAVVKALIDAHGNPERAAEALLGADVVDMTGDE